MSNQSVLNHFGLRRLGIYQGEIFRKYKQEIKDAINSNEMLAIIGDPGAGKSVLFQHVVFDMGVDPNKEPVFVYVNDWYREHMTISNIMNAIIYDLSDEGPRRDMEARSRQCTRILGNKHVNEGKKIVIIIEQSHRIHLNTLIALKELREAQFAGHYPLCSMILLGHPALEGKMERRKEIYLRTEFLRLMENEGWMTFEERVKYLTQVYREAITEKARERIAARKKTPLEILHYLKNKMKEEMQAGYNIIDENAVEPTLMEMKQDLEFSYSEIAKEASVSKTTVCDVFNQDEHHRKPEIVEAMKRLEEKKIAEIVRSAAN